MPLLKKRALVKAPMPEFLRDDEEIFHCEMTNEIFRDYEDFAERTILCNSMVWTCSMTGKSDLTFEEAQQSEERAKKILQDFPKELQVPLLYLATLTKRTSFSDMAEDVFSFMKDRYFLGEKVEACFATNKWREYHVVEVIAPTEEEIKNFEHKVKEGERQYHPPAALFKYNLEQLNPDDADITEKMMLDMTLMRRRRGEYTKDKSKLFLKQYVETASDGCFVIKQATLEEFGIKDVKFSMFFDGPLPDFTASKKLMKPISVEKKVRQETLAKFLSKNNVITNTAEGSNSNSLLHDMKKSQVMHKMMQEELKLKKEKLKQKNLEIASKIKEWNNPKEDLDLEDHQKLPEPMEVQTKIPDKYMGDALSVIEFASYFSKLLQTKNYFPYGVNIPIMEKALLEKKPGGPLIHLLQMLMSSLLYLQEEENTRYRTSVVDKISEKDVDDELSTTHATRLATLATNWCMQYQGVPFNKLPIFTLTISEVLRLHFLMSGARLPENNNQWRKANRGGYISEDDPAIYFRIHNSHIIKSLGSHNVVELPIGDKLKVLLCLMNQLLTYEEFRTYVEDKRLICRTARLQEKQTLSNEKKQIQELNDEIKELRNKQELTQEDINEIDELENQKEDVIHDNAKHIKSCHDTAVKELITLGYDRAFRRYFKLESVPGLFVNNEELYEGICLPEPVRHVPELANAESATIAKYFHRISDETNSSDKENEPKEEIKLNGHQNGKEITSFQELLMCSSDPSSCVVHPITRKGPRWSYYADVEQLEELMNTLNKRGYREIELKSNLTLCHDLLIKFINKTPSLNPAIEGAEKKTGFDNKIENFGYAEDLSVSDVLCNELVSTILELDEKLFAGYLGGIPKEKRGKWRKCIEEKDFTEFDTEIIKQDVDKKTEKDNMNEEIEEVAYKDPSEFIGKTTADIESEDSDSDTDTLLVAPSEKDRNQIKFLGIALVQLAYSINRKFLKAPLGEVLRGKKYSEKKIVKNILSNWEKSLLASTSYSQIFLHYGTLSKCIVWSKTMLKLRCKTCHKGSDTASLMVCNSCDSAQHLDCISPKINKPPKGNWLCKDCQREKESEDKEQEKVASKRKLEKLKEEDDDISTIFIESDAEQEPVSCSTCREFEGEIIQCFDCPSAYHLTCMIPPLRRAPRGKWICNHCKELNNKEENRSSSDSGDLSRRSSRREAETRNDLPLHNVALQELLTDVMKHRDAWAFIRPVQKVEVPDYYDVISKPMDFGTIKYKLNMGEYKYDAEFMADAQLIFDNCNSYNTSDAEVYKCGSRLLKYFSKKCKELNLSIPLDMQEEEDIEPKIKKKRTR